MKRLFRIFLFFFLCSLLFALLHLRGVPQAQHHPQHHLGGVYASAEFETSYQVRYQVNPNGVVRVSQDISLTNKLSNVYATQYSLTLQSGRIQNIQAHDEQGSLEIETSQTENLTQITLRFNQQVVGTGKTLNFNLSYDALDLATKTGQVWEISVPKLANPAEIDNYQLYLAVPIGFGSPAYISPKPIGTSQENDFQVFRFTKDQITQAGVSAAFGQFQVYDFILTYHLKNERITPVMTEIALPPDTAFQKVYYQSLEPEPNDVRVDEDGNWLARYTLKGNQKINVEASGKVMIFSQPQKNFPQTTQATLEKNLQEQEYWQVNHPLIQEKANQLKSARDVYNFVVNHLNYDFERVKQGVERLGALEALNQPEKAICMEFTDLFITLARAIGIPAREISGYAYTTNPKLRPLSLVADILHSWPEYWDDQRKIWVPVDPTWGKTTGGVDFFSKTDLNHFVFAIHGIDSQLPAPAGSYRGEEDGGKNVQVTFGKFEDLPESKIEVEFGLPKSIFSGIATKGKIIIYNPGPTAIYNLPTHISGENLSVRVLPDHPDAILPPYGKQEIPVEVVSYNWLKIGQGKINFSLGEQDFSQLIKIQSLIWQGILPLVGLLLLLGATAYFLYKLTFKRQRVTKERDEENSPGIHH